MKFKTNLMIWLLFLTAFVALTAIDPTMAFAKPPTKEKQSSKSKGHGPPPHAPAHGYRHKHHHGVVLEFDSGLGVYIAISLSGVYFHNGLYMKKSGDKWLVSSHFNTSWRIAGKGEIPYTLKKAKGEKPAKKAKSRGKKK